MYREHFGLDRPPFRITPQTEYFYSGAQRGPLLEALLFAVSNDEGIIRVSGEVGTGKTMLCRMLIERLPAETLVIYIANPSLSPAELIATVAHELEVQPAAGHSLLRQIERRLIELYASGRRVLAIIDEAHAMPRESLDQVRLLSNLETSTRKLLQIVLFGQPELDSLLDEKPMRSLRERITQSFQLQPLTQQQVRDYLDFRLRAAGYRGPELFSGKALELIARASRGLTRRINILADKTLLAAFADNTHSIGPQHARAALRDANYHPVRDWQKPVLIAGGLLLLTTAAAALIARSAAPLPTPASTAPSHKAQTGASLPQATSQTPLAAAPQPDADAERFAPIPEQLGPIARERLLASRAEIDQIADSQWFIQLRSIPASNAPSLEQFIPSAGKAVDIEQLRLYVVKDDPKQTIGVIYGNYASAQAAQAGLSQLPAWLKAGGAFARPFKNLRTQKTKAATDVAASAL